MARADALGIFWQDVKAEKPPPKEKVKVQPPEPVWLEPTYLPYLDEAIAFNIPLYTDSELIDAQIAGEILLFDIESYYNYFLISFRGVNSGKVVYFEMWLGGCLNLAKLHWVLTSFQIVGFNSETYDIPMAVLALHNLNTSDLKRVTQRIIEEDARPSDLYREYRIQNTAKLLAFNHIDLIEVAPLSASLKIYGGRCHTQKMQDLPFPHYVKLSPEQGLIVRLYCCNDLNQTGDLLRVLWPQLMLRKDMSHQYNIDLRSKSDAQIAEAVIKSEVERITGQKLHRPQFDDGFSFKYKAPAFIKFQTPLMQGVLEMVQNQWFELSESGSPIVPKAIEQLDLVINQLGYTMGNGGLHSKEKKVAHYSDEKYILRDADVASYYPFIILICKLFPKHIGQVFLRVYQKIVDTRIGAKRNGNKIIANALKIVINGSFGKLGSKWSVLFSPDLMIQVTITGQLCLLMLIEMLELAGFQVTSANTDGVVSKVAREREAEYQAICDEWQRRTGFELEFTDYAATFNKDVNNYIAIKLDKKTGKKSTKNKGLYYNPWADPNAGDEQLKKNPVNTICIEAVCQYLMHGTPIQKTVLSCTDIKQFISVRNVTGGGVKIWSNGAPNTYLGKACRWYMGDGETGNIVYAKSGKKVPKTDGAVPLMELPKELPPDLNYSWYIEEAESILHDIGAITHSGEKS